MIFKKQQEITHCALITGVAAHTYSLLVPTLATMLTGEEVTCMKCKTELLSNTILNKKGAPRWL